MSVSFYYANLTRREWFSVGAIGGHDSWRCLGLTLASRVFGLLLLDRWSGDSIAILRDTDANWGRCNSEFADLQADVILLLYRSDGFEGIGEAAEHNKLLFMEICHLIFTRQAMELEPQMKEKFGPQFRRRYKELCEDRELSRMFKPKDLTRLSSGEQETAGN